MSRTFLPAGGVLGAVVLACMSGACASAPVSSRQSGWGAPSSRAAVDLFLDAANREDYEAMWKVFGTKDGPAADRFGIPEVEQRMIFLSALLKHSGREMRQADLASAGPGRTRWLVRLEGTRKGDVTVPVITVPGPEGRWYVERLNVDALTSSAVP